MDSSYAIIALDQGAAAILDYHRDRSGKQEGAYPIDKNMIEAVRHAGVSDPFGLENVFLIGIGEFTCRTYLLESQDASLAQPLVGVLLERHLEARDAIDEVSTRYHLTKREQQALRGLSMGLSIKALAAKMNIKPSTLRAFLRLIKIKMGETTRAGIMVKILQKRQS